MSTSDEKVIVVDFDGDHPQDWPASRKWTLMATIAIPLFLMPLSSTMTTPTVNAIADEFHTTSSITGPLALSLFLLMYSMGPILLGPFSELYGRWPVLQVGSLFYLFFNLGAGFSTSMTQLLIFRLLSGTGASASLAVGSSIVGDVFRKEERGLPVALVSLGPVLGSCLGPIVGGFIADYTTWRWAFWSTSLAAGAFLVVCFIVARETYAPILLLRKKATLMAETSRQGKDDGSVWKTPFEKDETVGQLYRRTISRSVYFLGTQPIIQALACYYGYLYGIVYLLLSGFSDLWTTRYHMNVSTGSLHYIAPCIGYAVGAQICAFLTDRVYRYQVAKNNGVGKPEFRLPIMVPASFLVPIGLLIYGWSAEYQTHWIVPDIGIALPLMGATIIFQCCSQYLLDTFPVYAASANGAVYIVRGFTGFGFPLFSPVMYEKLGYGWGNSLLAFLALAIGCPIPFILWKYGEKLRALSNFAEK
ncbi:Major facilitator superfamily domain, general substrate transporter [Penicillium expansum]|uniref:Major facilitator superfamily domain, general substrate transporter n=1 Tax=Penicillium expansum TaxID=27334 RepID=A0A0A2JXK2_PENEN|nr:Major facilitator superfamily domain, general substrate transporter [Penicillium expansum]KGO40796.1 Major facilitator superfamily domain, general substrate transporter [Penicillium expansum]KGO48451.1 Major facilitator superfamily domain, general substrate transporter [Penicillium expansum]KGO59566.1 Major facilitator superfamily domain, general substrate transporter [Penicillium expansum]